MLLLIHLFVPHPPGFFAGWLLAAGWLFFQPSSHPSFVKVPPLTRGTAGWHKTASGWRNSASSLLTSPHRLGVWDSSVRTGVTRRKVFGFAWPPDSLGILQSRDSSGIKHGARLTSVAPQALRDIKERPRNRKRGCCFNSVFKDLTRSALKAKEVLLHATTSSTE